MLMYAPPINTCLHQIFVLSTVYYQLHLGVRWMASLCLWMSTFATEGGATRPPRDHSSYPASTEVWRLLLDSKATCTYIRRLLFIGVVLGKMFVRRVDPNLLTVIELPACVRVGSWSLYLASYGRNCMWSFWTLQIWEFEDSIPISCIISISLFRITCLMKARLPVSLPQVLKENLDSTGIVTYR